MKKLSLSMALIMLLVGILSACGGSNSSEAPKNKENQGAAENEKGEEEDKPITLKLAIWGSESHVQMYNDIAAEYKKIKPNITVDVVIVPWADYQQKLSIMVASKTAPDIAWVAERMVPQFMEAGHIIDISKIAEDSAYQMDDFITSTLASFQKDGKLYGIPFSTPPLVTFYNKTLFEKHGLKTPMELYEAGNWNYEELAKAAKTISNPNEGVYGVQFMQASSGWMDNYVQALWAAGTDVLSEDGTEFAMNTPGAAKAFDYLKELLDSRAHTSLGEQLTFETGKLGMKLENVTRVSAYNANATDFDWDIAPLPDGEQPVPTPLGLAGYSIFKGSKHEEEAMEFLKYISSGDSAMRVAEFFVPQRKSVLYSDQYLNQAPHPSAETLKIAAYDRMEDGQFRPGHPNWVRIDEQVVIYLDNFFTGSMTAAEALEEMQKKIQPLLK